MTRPSSILNKKIESEFTIMKNNQIKANKNQIDKSSNREVKLKNLNEKYEKNLSKYQQHRTILQDLLKAEGINRLEPTS